MPPDELFEWETLLRIENEEQERNQRKAGSSGKRSRLK